MNIKLYTFRAEYPGLSLELKSDDIRLLNVRFVRKKREESIVDNLSHPIMNCIRFLEDYFSGRESEVKVVLSDTPDSGDIKYRRNELLVDLSRYTPGQRRIYSELMKTVSGDTITYGELASRSGFERGGRFAGNCMAVNSFPVIIPCHRVVKSDGAIGNYTGGVHIKRVLLDHENAIAPIRQNTP